MWMCVEEVKVVEDDVEVGGGGLLLTLLLLLNSLHAPCDSGH